MFLLGFGQRVFLRGRFPGFRCFFALSLSPSSSPLPPCLLGAGPGALPFFSLRVGRTVPSDDARSGFACVQVFPLFSLPGRPSSSLSLSLSLSLLSLSLSLSLSLLSSSLACKHFLFQTITDMLIWNDEFLASIYHQPVQTTSLTFSHTACRSYRLSVSVDYHILFELTVRVTDVAPPNSRQVRNCFGINCCIDSLDRIPQELLLTFWAFLTYLLKTMQSAPRCSRLEFCEHCS